LNKLVAWLQEHPFKWGGESSEKDEIHVTHETADPAEFGFSGRGKTGTRTNKGETRTLAALSTRIPPLQEGDATNRGGPGVVRRTGFPVQQVNSI